MVFGQQIRLKKIFCYLTNLLSQFHFPPPLFLLSGSFYPLNNSAQA